MTSGRFWSIPGRLGGACTCAGVRWPFMWLGAYAQLLRAPSGLAAGESGISALIPSLTKPWLESLHNWRILACEEQHSLLLLVHKLGEHGLYIVDPSLGCQWGLLSSGLGGIS